ncbi:MAG: aliphatic sulfonates ABC transporter substrate-binding protein, partial [Parafilimonas terrae]|nr:aliphatic sulfonates ABC transporter substrate-binding protein [Parafilimonas terrae]
MLSTRRSLLAAGLALACLGSALVREARADDPKEVRLDWATYNPVGLLLKEKGFLEEALAPRGIKVRWVQSLGSNKALE